jgi:hypothetical protein
MCASTQPGKANSLSASNTSLASSARISGAAISESKAAAMGGVTSSLNYIRTGAYYLNRGGPYREVMPEVLKLSDGRFWVD